MQIKANYYNFLAFFETKLRFRCIAAQIMTIMKCNYSLTSNVQLQSRARDIPPSGLCFLETMQKRGIS